MASPAMAPAPFDGAIAERAHKTLGLLTIADLFWGSR